MAWAHSLVDQIPAAETGQPYVVFQDNGNIVFNFGQDDLGDGEQWLRFSNMIRKEDMVEK